GRARKESRATSIVNMNEYGAQDLTGRGISGTEFWAAIIKRFLDERGLRRVAVAPYFPVAEADRLREMGIELVVANDLRDRRRTKRPDEIDAIEAAQRATEDAWREGVDALRLSKPRPDRTLELDGAAFTRERPRGSRARRRHHLAGRIRHDASWTEKGPVRSDAARLHPFDRSRCRARDPRGALDLAIGHDAARRRRRRHHRAGGLRPRHRRRPPRGHARHHRKWRTQSHTGTARFSGLVERGAALPRRASPP